jgi:unsaturated rhamnogalacturonyl hydrolase
VLVLYRIPPDDSTVTRKPRGIVETSATAGIAAALFRAANLGVFSAETFRSSAWRAIGGLHPYVTDDGTVTRTSAGTVLQLVPCGYSVIRDDRIQPWGQGLGLHAYAAALVTRTCSGSRSLR